MSVAYIVSEKVNAQKFYFSIKTNVLLWAERWFLSSKTEEIKQYILYILYAFTWTNSTRLNGFINTPPLQSGMSINYLFNKFAAVIKFVLLNKKKVLFSVLWSLIIGIIIKQSVLYLTGINIIDLNLLSLNTPFLHKLVYVISYAIISFNSILSSFYIFFDILNPKLTINIPVDNVKCIKKEKMFKVYSMNTSDSPGGNDTGSGASRENSPSDAGYNSESSQLQGGLDTPIPDPLDLEAWKQRVYSRDQIMDGSLTHSSECRKALKVLDKDPSTWTGRDLKKLAKVIDIEDLKSEPTRELIESSKNKIQNEKFNSDKLADKSIEQYFLARDMYYGNGGTRHIRTPSASSTSFSLNSEQYYSSSEPESSNVAESQESKRRLSESSSEGSSEKKRKT